LIELSMVAVPPTPERLRAIAQIGIENLVQYDMSNDADKFETFPAFVESAARLGLRVPLVEAGPPLDRIVLGKPGWREQIEQWKRSIEFLGRHGVEVICYNFMPQVLADAMVVRTRLDAVTRGGAVTSAFRLEDVTRETAPHNEMAVPMERMWEQLEEFLRAVLPIAEACGVRLAMHPDDPPLSPICGLERIMSSVESFDRLLAIDASPSNAVTLCAGCFGELGVDVPALVDRFGPRIAFAHFRNIEGTLTDFIETFPDQGIIDLIGLFEKLDTAPFKTFVRADHAPLLATEPAAEEDGYGFQGHLYTSGYMRGALDTVRRLSTVSA